MTKSLLKKLDELISLMKEEKEKRLEREEKERSEERTLQLLEYARKHQKKYAEEGIRSSGIYSSNERREADIRSKGELIPFSLSEMDKEILREFYK